MIRIKSNSLRNIDKLAIKHYKGVRDIALTNLNRSSTPTVFSKYLISSVGLKQIITAKPDELLRINKNAEKYFRRKGISDSVDLLKFTFNYTKFARKERVGYNAYSLAENLNVKTCAYCNRQYTFTVSNKLQKVVRPSFDHFFPQSDFPMLRLSFYNLIPSCDICNSRLKLKTEFNLRDNIHPYHNEFGSDGTFNYYPFDYKSAIGLADQMKVFVEINPHSPNKIKIENNTKTFKIDELYSQHGDIISEIIRKAYLTDNNYIELLASMYNESVTKEELYQLAFNNYFKEEDFERRVLAKLTKDIAQQIFFDHL
jgi:hypothetical protein